MSRERIYPTPDFYELALPSFRRIFIPQAKKYVDKFGRLHPEIEVKLWCPDPTRASRSVYNLGRLERPSERHVHLLAYKPAGRAGRKAERYHPGIIFVGAGRYDHVTLPEMVQYLSDADKVALGDLVANIFQDSVCRSLIWVPDASRGRSQKQEFPPNDPHKFAILYKFFPKRK